MVSIFVAICALQFLAIDVEYLMIKRQDGYLKKGSE